MTLRSTTAVLAWTLAVLLTLETSALPPPYYGLSAPATTIGTNIYLADLLSSCVAASTLGCAEVRRVQRERAATGHMAVEWKDPRDARSALTAADLAAQVAIMSELRRQWPGLRVVGEEDEDEDDVRASVMAAAPPVDHHRGMSRDPRFCTAVADSELTARLEDIVVYVDPVDGTREFVEGRLRSCVCLIGVALNGRASAGVIGVPFPHGDLSTEPAIVYGLVGAGAGTIGTLPRRPAPSSHAPPYIAWPYEALPRPFVASGQSTSSVMQACRAAVLEQGGGGSSLVYGGAGNKILAVAMGEADVCIQAKFGGPWDTCGPEAIITAMGGRMTDIYGDQIAVYAQSASATDDKIDGSAVLSSKLGEVETPDNYGNALGFLATGPDSAICHEALCEKLRGMSELKRYKEDVLRAAESALPFGLTLPRGRG